MRGRKPKPTALKLLEGNPGHRPINGTEPEAPCSGMKECPDFITGDAREFWFREGPGLVQMKTLTDVDFVRFEDLCLRYAEKVFLQREINVLRQKRADSKKKRLSGKDDIRLQTIESQHRKASAQFAQFAGEFGMGASSRTRIKLPDGQLPLPGMGGERQPEPEDALARAQRLAQ